MVVFARGKSSDKISSNMREDDKEERHFSDEDENWTKLQDISSRRRIQNRISQRKRRRRLRENSLSQSENSRSNSASPPARDSGTPKQRPELSRSNTNFLERPYLNTHTRSRSTSQISDFSLSSFEGDITPTQHNPNACLPSIEQNMPSMPQPQLAGNWDQQFFDQAFMSELQDFEGGTVDFLYQAGAAGMFASPAYPSSNYSPALSYTSEGSIDGSLDGVHIDPKLTNDYDDLLNTHPFNGGNDLCLTPPSFEYDCLATKSFPFQPAAQNNGYPTPPSSLPSLQSTPETHTTSTFTDTSGNTALHLAASKGHMGIVQLLLDTGIPINAPNKDMSTSLHIAVAANNLSMAGLLLEKGATPENKNALGQTALHLAVEKGDVGLVSLVLDYLNGSEEVDARDCLGQTALHRAVAMGWEEVVRVMLLRGVNSQAKVGGGKQQPMMA